MYLKWAQITAEDQSGAGPSLRAHVGLQAGGNAIIIVVIPDGAFGPDFRVSVGRVEPFRY